VEVFFASFIGSEPYLMKQKGLVRYLVGPFSEIGGRENSLPYRKEAKDSAGLLKLGRDNDEGGDFQNGPE
jgi:hypothetical protein